MVAECGRALLQPAAATLTIFSQTHPPPEQPKVPPFSGLAQQVAIFSRFSEIQKSQNLAENEK